MYSISTTERGPCALQTIKGEHRMKMKSRFAAIVLAAGFFVAPALTVAQRYPGPPPAWDAPPSSYRADLQRRAYRDGITGAQRDLQNRRRPNVNNRDEYRNYRGPDPRGYRDAFQAGYQSFWRHNGPPRY
jgi:hypothetical protein